MSRTSMKTIRALGAKELTERIQESRSELAKLRVDLAKGTLRKDNGKIKPLRRDIARMMTRQMELTKK